MSPEQLSALNDNVQYVRERVDEIQKEQSDLRVSVEHRLTAVPSRTRFPLAPATLRAGGWISAGMISTVHTP